MHKCMFIVRYDSARFPLGRPDKLVGFVRSKKEVDSFVKKISRLIHAPTIQTESAGSNHKYYLGKEDEGSIAPLCIITAQKIKRANRYGIEKTIKEFLKNDQKAELFWYEHCNNNLRMTMP